ncbi:MAG: cysteine desulfurase [Candidatus Eisenbacteria bacterium]|uniref:Cysteine desulfurase n=1 Tax=Eiseniibacteriota bacterium TaxID=2212470 RepID=A0A948W5E4_UNCEI|nr:cysteine desulfurase [Candidatus Eisenbacteria bacterium]MBU1951080.1 cysteine desulfurase [Candidatus Eisenbacteria bacterium]MBU2693217.1 cysteine desulfurase [Candidatus Eisenbacteria bacterium]
MNLINLDHNATTPLLPEVRKLMTEAMEQLPGNPSSLHREGRRALEAIEKARGSVARLIGASAEEIVFTSGGTEANALALMGTLFRTGKALMISAIEHPSVMETAAHLARLGHVVQHVSPDNEGRVSIEAVKEGLSEDVGLVSLQLANNETGVLQPVGDLRYRIGGNDLIIHTDAVQAAGKIPVSVRDLNVQLMTLSAHKMGGPKGIGALWIDSESTPLPILHGGLQERGLRAGTQNVIGIAGFGAAAELAMKRLSQPDANPSRLRDRLETEVQSRLLGTVVMGGGAERVPNTSCIAFRNLEGAALVQLLDLKGVAASTGAACEARSNDYSHVLRAMAVPESLARGAVRFSLGLDITEKEITEAIGIIVEAVEELEGYSSAVRRIIR